MILVVSRGLLSPLFRIAGTVVLAAAAAAATGARPPRAPRFPTSPAAWIGAPATWEALHGRVVMLDVWTFG
jgi:hypothetical protein